MFNVYIPLADYWMIIDNSGNFPEIIADGVYNTNANIFSQKIWEIIKRMANE